MRFLFSRKLTLLFLIFAIVATSVTLVVVRHAALASSPLLSSTPTVLFNGMDEYTTNQLWSTNGTANGTQKLTNLTGTGPNLNPTNITPFGNQAAFRGTNASGNATLWVTDGTSGGTHELTGIANASSLGIRPTDITAFGKKFLFDGVDANGNYEIWISDGTAANTTEITNIPGTTGYGMDFADITVFGTTAIFYEGITTGTIWVTNGTLASTHQLASMTKSGLVYPSGTDFTLFNNEILFAGSTDGFTLQLWITDGTTAGTQEVNPVWPNDITVYGNQALFNGQQQATFGNGPYGLWITDGTNGGTQQLSSSTNPVSTADIAAFGNKALFGGNEANGNFGMWTTNGTSAGTQKLVALTPAYLSDPEITSIGTLAIFFGYGMGANDTGDIWVSDGTATGTKVLTPIKEYFIDNGRDATDITSIGSQALFAGVGTDGSLGLWITNGTTTGTLELMNIVHAYIGGISPSNMAVLASSSPSPTPTPIPPRHKLFFFLQGFTSSLDKSGAMPYDTFGRPNGIYDTLRQDFPGSDFQLFSYASINSPTFPAYSCPDTFSQTIPTYVGYIRNQLYAYLTMHPNTDVYLVGHSFGGAIAFAFMEDVARKGGIVNNGRIAGVVTLDSPVGGIFAGPIDKSVLEQVYKSQPGCQGATAFAAVDSLRAVFHKNMPIKVRSYGSGDTILPQPGAAAHANQYFAEQVAQNTQTEVLTIGNSDDYIYDLNACPNSYNLGKDEVLSTQWIQDKGPGSHVYARDLATGITPCPTITKSAINHSLVYANTNVIAAIVQLVRGQTPGLSIPVLGI